MTKSYLNKIKSLTLTSLGEGSNQFTFPHIIASLTRRSQRFIIIYLSKKAMNLINLYYINLNNSI